MAFCDTARIKLYYEEKGAGEIVIFLHGFTLDSRMWKGQIEHFGSSYRVIIKDSRGHGRSEAPITGYARDDRVEDLLGFADKMGIERFHLVGLSMGGTTGIGFALKYQDRLKSLSLISTGAAGYRSSKRLSKLDEMAREQGLEAAREKWIDWSLRYHKGRNEAIADELEMMMRDHSGAIWIDKMRGKYPRTYDLENVHKINLPTLIMAGEHDKVFVKLSKEINKKIVNSQFILLDNVGHMLNMEAADRCNAELKLFLEGVG